MAIIKEFKIPKALYALVVILGLSSLSLTSCKTKEGCGLEEKYNNVDLESSKRGKSNLFSNKQQKKMKKNR